MKLTIREYLTPDGGSPFPERLDRLEVSVRARIQARVLRFEMGDLYFGKERRSTILLLLGGDKAFQTRDIHQARQFSTKYLEATSDGKAQ